MEYAVIGGILHFAKAEGDWTYRTCPFVTRQSDGRRGNCGTECALFELRLKGTVENSFTPNGMGEMRKYVPDTNPTAILHCSTNCEYELTDTTKKD